MSDAGPTAVRVSVVIPCRNAAGDLGGQLQALEGQTFDGCWEVIVVDNGSSDATGSVAEGFAGRVPHLRVVSEPRPGRALACNAGVTAAAGDAVIFLDADDLACPTYVEEMARALAEHPFVASRLDCDSLNPGWVRATREPAQCRGLGHGFLPYGYGCTLGIRKSLFESVGGFSPTPGAGEDIDLCWRVQQRGVPLTFVPQAVLRYRFRTGLVEVYRQGRAYGEGAVRLFVTYRPAGLEARRPVQVARHWAGTLRRLLVPRSKGEFGRGVYLLGNRVGHLRGSIRHRVLYL